MTPSAGLAVLHTISSSGFYGAEKVILDLINYQRRRAGLRPALIDLVDPAEAESELARRLRARGGSVIRIETPRGFSLASLRSYASLVRDYRADVVHSHGYKATFYHVVSRAVGMHSVPLVVTAHGHWGAAMTLRSRLYDFVDTWLLRHAQAIVAVSNGMADFVRSRSPQLRVRTIANGIDTELALSEAHPLPAFLAERGRGEGLVVGAVGRLAPMKNHTLLIDVIAELRRVVPCELVILGDGPLRQQLESQWRTQIPDVEPLLVPHQSAVLDWVRDMDVFCLPSGQGEGLPMVLLEAGLLQRAVVTSNSGGIADLVRNDENGILFAMGDRAALRDGLLRLLREPATRERLGAALKATVLQKHDAKTMESEYFAVYQSLLGA